MYNLACALFLLIISYVAAAEEGSACLTPNGETGTCITIHSCKVIQIAITYLDKDAIEFARKSQCGFNGKDPMVCCGSTAYMTTTRAPQEDLFEVFTQPSSTPLVDQQSTSLEPIDNVHLPDRTLCGIQIDIKNRIVGGTATELGEFPWMAALLYTKEDGSDGGNRCSGTLISHKYVLTAAQCLSILGYNLTHIRLGEWKLSTKKDCVTYGREEICSDDPVEYQIIEKLPHPYYSKKSGNNDIALLQLDRKVKFTDFIRPICLPPSDLPPPPAGTWMDISGWGLTENGSLSDVKRKVKVPMVSNKRCSEVYTNYTHVNPNQACAGGEGGKDACSGDSGGPLMRTYAKEDAMEEDQWFQEGIIYRGLGCGRKDIPSLYTRISRYTYWILNHLK